MTVPPDIPVEIVSERPRDQRRDRVVEKLDEHAAFGVRRHRLVDPQARTVEILEPHDGRYLHVLGATVGRVEDVPGCPGLVLDLDALWAPGDEVSRED